MCALESDFQSHLITELTMLVGMDGYVLHVDTSLIQGFPDILILYKGRWAALECKKGPKGRKQPNQDYYVEHLNELAFARFIYPENEEEVINDLQQALRIR
jgi:hypothetical protein